MTLDTFIDQNAGVVLAALIATIPGTIGTVLTFLNGRRAKVTRSLLRQDAEAVKCEVRAIRPGVKHDLENGVGTAMAQKVVEHITPVLAASAAVVAVAKEDAVVAATMVKEDARAAAQEVVNTAVATAASLAASQPVWDGVERRCGTDRRGGGE